MKILMLFAFLVTCSVSFAQNAELDSLKNYLKFNKDSFTDKVTLEQKDSISGLLKDGSPYVIRLTGYPKLQMVTLTIGCPKAGCLDPGYVNLVLSDSTKTTAANSLPVNCLGAFSTSWYKMSGQYKLLQKLSTTPIIKIRINGRITFAEIYLSLSQSSLLFNQIKWMKYYYDNQRKVDKAAAL